MGFVAAAVKGNAASAAVAADPQGWAKSTASLANAYAERIEGESWRNLETSIKYHEEALEAIQFEDDPVFYANCLIDISESYLSYSKGNFSDNVEIAICYLEQSLSAINQIRITDRTAHALILLSNAYRDRIRGKKLDNLRYSLTLFNKAKNLYEEDFDHNSFGYLSYCQLCSKLLKMEEEYDESPSIGKGGQLDWEGVYSDLENKINSTSKEKSSYDWCLLNLHLCKLTIQFGPKSDDSTPTFIANIIKLFIGSKSRAERVLSLAIEKNYLHVTQECNFFLNQCCQLIFRASELLNHLQKEDKCTPSMGFVNQCSKEYLKEAIIILERIYNSRPTYGYESFKIRYGLELADLYIYDGRDDDALSIFHEVADASEVFLAKTAENTLEANEVLKRLDRLIEDAPFIAIKSSKIDYAWIMAERGRARLLYETIHAFTGSGLEAKHRDQLLNCRNKINTLEDRLSSSFIVDKMTPLRQLIQTRDEVSTLLSAGRKVQSWNTASNRTLLDACIANNRCIVLMVQSAHGGYLSIAYKEGNEVKFIIAETGDTSIIKSAQQGIQDNTITFRSACSEAINRTDITPGLQYSLWDLIGGPLTDALADIANQVEEVVLIPQGALAALPFALAKNETSGETLIDRYAFSYSVNLSLFSVSMKQSEKLSDNDKLLIVANPALSESSKLKTLKYAEVECSIIKSFFKGKSICLANSEATFQSVFSAMPATRLWHFACHCDFDTLNPKNSSLYLANGDKLTAQQISSLDLAYPPTYVVLSACSSGLIGTNELPNEFNGFINALLGIGVKGVFVSLWNVIDPSTCFLMSKLYHNLFDEQRHPAEALRNAQLWLRNAHAKDLTSQIQSWLDEEIITYQNFVLLDSQINHDSSPFKHPRHWGAFVYYGT